MDVGKMIDALSKERDGIDEIIQALQRLVDRGGMVTGTQRRGRKFMDKAGRREVSERMKRYWENKKQGQQKAAQAAETKGSGGGDSAQMSSEKWGLNHSSAT